MYHLPFFSFYCPTSSTWRLVFFRQPLPISVAEFFCSPNALSVVSWRHLNVEDDTFSPVRIGDSYVTLRKVAQWLVCLNRTRMPVYLCVCVCCLYSLRGTSAQEEQQRHSGAWTWNSVASDSRMYVHFILIAHQHASVVSNAVRTIAVK